MPTRLRKTRKTRGNRTLGWGRIGQHRKTGSRPYRKANRHKQGWSYVTTYEPNYFGKHGFTSPQSLHTNENVINLIKLDQLAQGSEINLTQLGYTKLLGTGKITKPLTIQVATCSKTAQEKVTQAGGKIISSQKNGE